jgi:hypothetical protein
MRPSIPVCICLGSKERIGHILVLKMPSRNRRIKAERMAAEMKVRLRHAILEGRPPSQWMPKGSEWPVRDVTELHPDLPGVQFYIVKDSTGREVGLTRKDCEVIEDA